MSYEHNKVPPLPLLDCTFGVVMIGMTLFLTGCLAGFPIQSEKTSDHFDISYIETHQGSTREEVVRKLGVPDDIFRSKDKTYYVYDATGDTRMIVGAVFIVPPFFVPFWTPKDEGDALHCLALVFDDKGLLQDYIAETAPEEAWGGLLLPPQPGAWPWRDEVTACVKVLWGEEDMKKLEGVARYKRSDSAGRTALVFAEVDGAPLVSVTDRDYTLHLWDVRSDCLLDISLSGHEDLVTTGTFVELDNVPVIITGSADQTIRLWDARTGHLLYEPLRGHGDRITHVAVMEVNEVPTVFSGGDDRIVRMWDARTGQPLGEVDGLLLAVGNMDGAPFLVTSNFDYSVQIRELRSGTWLSKPLMHYGDVPTVVTAVAFAEVDRKPVIAIGSQDGSVRLWDVRSGTLSGNAMRSDRKPVSDLSFGVLGVVPVLFSVDEANTIHRWNASTGGYLSQSVMSGEGEVTAISFFAVDGEPVIASSRNNRNVHLWDAHSGSQIRESMWYDADLVDHYATEAILEITAQEGDSDSQLQLYWDLAAPDRLKWLCRAAVQDNSEARYRLGLLYEHGKETVKKDYVKAYQWYTLSAKLEDDWAGGAARAAANRIGRNLTPDQLANGKRLISEWLPDHCVIETEIKKRSNKRKCVYN